YDHGDDYAARLRETISKREPDRLIDRLLVFAVIEGRSAERLGLLARAITDAATATLYAGLADAEVRHRDTFLALAADVEVPTVDVAARATALATREAEILTAL